MYARIRTCLLLFLLSAYQSSNFKTFEEPKNRFQGINFPSLFILAGRYDNPILTRFLATIDCFKNYSTVWGNNRFLELSRNQVRYEIYKQIFTRVHTVNWAMTSENPGYEWHLEDTPGESLAPWPQREATCYKESIPWNRYLRPYF